MTFLKASGTALIFCLGAMAPVYGQKEDSGQQDQHAEQPRQRAEQPRQQQQRAAQPQQQQRAAQPQQRAEQQRAEQQRAEQQPQQQRGGARQQQRSQQAQAPAQQSWQHGRGGQQQPQRSPQRAQSWQQTRGWANQGSWQPRNSFQESRDRNWASDHRDWGQRGGYGGFYIPQTTFGVYFGESHFFHIGRMPTMYMGYPRFNYGGYSFLMVDPWPYSWREDWYDSDDLYIDYDDGYYLYDRSDPDVRLAITVVM